MVMPDGQAQALLDDRLHMIELMGGIEVGIAGQNETLPDAREQMAGLLLESKY